MTLLFQKPDPLPPDPSRHERVTFRSPADGSEQWADVYAPARPVDGPMPLVLAPHPITWTAEENYHGGWSGYVCGYYAGWYGLADKYGVVIAVPHGHHRREALCSLAAPEQIADLNYLIDLLPERGYPIDVRRVYACGLSMGGQEALVLAGCHPDRIAAVVAFNPVVDLAAWHDDLENHPDASIRAFGTAARIAHEVGGRPEAVPERYVERSATAYVEALASVPTLIYWSEKDIIVPGQATRHSYRLYQLVKARSPLAPFAEYNHTTIHGPIDDTTQTCFQLHEWCDNELALRWMLNHTR